MCTNQGCTIGPGFHKSKIFGAVKQTTSMRQQQVPITADDVLKMKAIFFLNKSRSYFYTKASLFFMPEL